MSYNLNELNNFNNNFNNFNNTQQSILNSSNINLNQPVRSKVDQINLINK